MPSGSEAEGQQFKPDLGTSIPIWRLHGHRHEDLGVRGIIELLYSTRIPEEYFGSLRVHPRATHPAVVQVMLQWLQGVQQSTCRTVLRDAQDLARTRARPSRGSWDGQSRAPIDKTWAGPYPGQQT